MEVYILSIAHLKLKILPFFGKKQKTFYYFLSKKVISIKLKVHF